MPRPVVQGEEAPAFASDKMTSSSSHGRSPRSRRPTTTPWAVLLTVAVCFVSHALAGAVPPVEPRDVVPKHGQPSLLGGRSASLPWQRLGVPLQKRADDESSSSESSKPTPTTTSSNSDATSSTDKLTTTFSLGATGSSTTTPTSASTTVASASPLPSILDSLFSDFTPDPNGGEPPCQKFINSFLNDDTFKQCYPLSMLLELSQSFFEAQKSMSGITRTLDATCAANPTVCNDYFQQISEDLLREENCGPDFNRVQLVKDIYKTMRAYAPVYSAGCLRDPDTGAYCYANAVTNTSNPSSTYIYFLPLNRTLPGSTVPECNYCLKQTMALYQAATADRRQYIADTYEAAAKQVNLVCKQKDFVNESLAAEVVPNAAGRVGGAPQMLETVGLAVVVAGFVGALLGLM